MRLIINGHDIELPPNVTIARTIQANDIANVATRQTNYTSTFNIPRTASNTKVFDMLGLIGNDSNIPYQKNEAYLYDDNGFTLLNKGYAVISETASDFKCNIFDGIIDFYKAIENKTLQDLDLSLLEHDKTPANVLATQNLSKPYAYLLADYNGKVIFDNKINTDFLVPAVKVPFIWQKIEQFSGFQLNGSFKSDSDFVNLFLTYPKATPPTISDPIYTNLNIDRDVITADFNNRIVFPMLHFYDFIDSSKLDVTTDTKSIIALERIQIQVIFTINPNFTAFQDGIEYTPSATFNGETFLCDGSIREISKSYTLNANETLSFPFEFQLDPTQTDFVVSVNDFFNNMAIRELTTQVPFETEFEGMSIKEFLTEILWRFNLTMYPTSPNTYELKRLPEILNTPPIDWSNKFNSLDSENYIYGDYGQRSWLRYQYNDENSFFNDGHLDINNTNLQPEKTIIASKIYSPDFNLSLDFFIPKTNLYRFWEKVPKEGSTEIEYKSLSNRFYFLKAKEIEIDKFMTSEVIGASSSVYITDAIMEDFSNLSFRDIVANHYSEMSALLNKSKILNVTMRLNTIDIANIDLSVPIHIEQLGGSFLINKISNFIPYQNTKVELIKISK